MVTLYQLQLPSHHPSRLSLVSPYITSPALQNHIISLPLFHNSFFLHLQTISPQDFHSTRQLILHPTLLLIFSLLILSFLVTPHKLLKNFNSDSLLSLLLTLCHLYTLADLPSMHLSFIESYPLLFSIPLCLSL